MTEPLRPQHAIVADESDREARDPLFGHQIRDARLVPGDDGRRRISRDGRGYPRNRGDRRHERRRDDEADGAGRRSGEPKRSPVHGQVELPGPRRHERGRLSLGGHDRRAVARVEPIEIVAVRPGDSQGRTARRTASACADRQRIATSSDDVSVEARPAASKSRRGDGGTADGTCHRRGNDDLPSAIPVASISAGGPNSVRGGTCFRQTSCPHTGPSGYHPGCRKRSRCPSPRSRGGRP
jgi:hypothetical protein